MRAMSFEEMRAEMARQSLEMVRSCTDDELREAARLTRDPEALARIARVWRERHPKET